MTEMPEAEHPKHPGPTPRDRPAGWAVLPPLTRTVAAWSAVLLLVTGALFVIGYVAVVLTPLTLALAATLFLAALLQPVAAGLRRLRLPDVLSALGAVIALVAAVVIPTWLIWSIAVKDFAELSRSLSSGVDRLRDLVASGDSPISPAQLDRLSAQAESLLTSNAGMFVSGALSVLEIAGAILLVVVLLFFFLKDGRRMSSWALDRLPARRRPAAVRAADVAWLTLTRYVHGTIVVAAIDAIGIGVALLVLRVPLAAPLALLVFVGSFVPMVGATVTGLLAVLVALAAKGPLTALLVGVAVIVVQQTEGNLLEPLIMKRQVRLHPVVVLVVVTAGALAWGVAGAFLAVPLAAVVYRVGETLLHPGPGESDPLPVTRPGRGAPARSRLPASDQGAAAPR